MENASPTYAGFWVRAGAAALDTLLGLVLLAPLSVKLMAYSIHLNWLFPVLLNWVLPAMATVLFWHYQGATPGKIMLRLRIVDARTGDAPPTAHLINRYLGYLASLACAGLGFFWVAWDKRKQGWHDIFADTVVVRVTPSAQERRWWMGAALVLVISIVVGASYGVYFFKSKLSGFVSAGQKFTQEGAAFAAGKTELDCVRAGVEHDARSTGFTDHLHATAFMGGCLNALPRTDAFCAEVPPPTEIMKTALWKNSLCQSMHRTDPFCNQLFDPVQRHCFPSN